MSNKLLLAIGGVAAVLILALAAVLLLVVAGGGGSDGDSGDEPSASNTEENGDDGDEPATSGELRIRGDDPLFLDPAVIQDAGSAFYVVEIFSGLVRLDKDLQIQPTSATAGRSATMAPCTRSTSIPMRSSTTTVPCSRRT